MNAWITHGECKVLPEFLLSMHGKRMGVISFSISMHGKCMAICMLILKLFYYVFFMHESNILIYFHTWRMHGLPRTKRWQHGKCMDILWLFHYILFMHGKCMGLIFWFISMHGKRMGFFEQRSEHGKRMDIHGCNILIYFHAWIMHGFPWTKRWKHGKCMDILWLFHYVLVMHGKCMGVIFWSKQYTCIHIYHTHTPVSPQISTAWTKWRCIFLLFRGVHAWD